MFVYSYIENIYKHTQTRKHGIFFLNLQNVIKILKRNKIQKRIKISKKSRKGSRTFGALNCQYFSIYQILGIIMKGIELKRKQNQIIIKT